MNTKVNMDTLDNSNDLEGVMWAYHERNVELAKENDRLKQALDGTLKGNDMWVADNDRLYAENDKLYKEIDRLKIEVEELESELELYCDMASKWIKDRDAYEAEIERLKAQLMQSTTSAQAQQLAAKDAEIARLVGLLKEKENAN